MKSSDGSNIEIAIKAPKMCLLNEGAVVDFHEEAKTTISLKHDNIVKCLGYGNTCCGFLKLERLLAKNQLYSNEITKF